MNKIISKTPGKIPKGYWQSIYNRDGPNCYECGKRTILPSEHRALVKGSNRYSADIQNALRNLRFSFGHVVPVARGGEDSLDNIVGEHSWCNNEKRDEPSLTIEQVLLIRGYADNYIPQLLNLLKSK